jgi:hypothetical protein
MPRHIDPPKSYDERGGLPVVLDEDAEKHNGLGYKEFVARVRQNEHRKHKIPAAAHAEDFNVSTRTWYGWLTRYKNEQKKLTSAHPQA